MGPKRSDNTNRGRRPSQTGVNTEDQENQQCTGKLASDLEFCCRDPPSAYPVNIPVYIRGRSSISIPNPPVPLANVPSLTANILEDPNASSIKRTSRGRIPSISHSAVGIDNETKSSSVVGQEIAKSTSISFRTFTLVRDSECFRPKLLADTVNNESETVEQIHTLYMRAWQLDQRFMEILKRILPLQEQLHTLNFCFVGLNEQTIYGFADVCALIKNLKTISLDGNPQAADHFPILIEREDLKIANLSLRFCKITDGIVERFAQILGNISTQNFKLLTLTLTGNQIGDNGAKSLAKALRYNRTLISLNLSSNFITDKGACALALILRNSLGDVYVGFVRCLLTLFDRKTNPFRDFYRIVLRKITLTEDEIVRRRYLLSERYAEAHFEDMRNVASSPTLSIGSTRSRSSREGKRLVESHKRRKSITTKTTDKRHRAESSDEARPPSANKPDLKKGKADGTAGRSSSINPRRQPAEQPRASNSGRGKKGAASVSSSKKNISIVKEEDEDIVEELVNLQLLHPERDNPLLEINDIETQDGQICLKGNLVVLNLNLSRNYLSLLTVEEFLKSIQHQTKLTRFNDAASFASTTASLIEFSGLCRLELKGMNDIPMKSPTHQTLQNLLQQKSPMTRFQQIKDREAKEEQQTGPVPPAVATEKTRVSSSVKPSGQRPASRMKD